MRSTRTAIAGIPIPDSTIARETTEFLGDVATPVIFDHSRRVFLWGSLYAEQLLLDYDAELFYVAAMFHDLGLLHDHRSEHERFEIDGANAARAFLERHGLPEATVGIVWDAIALHTTAQIPRYKQPEVRLLNWGVDYDIAGRDFAELSVRQREVVIAAYPRTGFEDEFLAALADTLRNKPQTVQSAYQMDIVEATNSSYRRPNFCDIVRYSPFAGVSRDPEAR